MKRISWIIASILLATALVSWSPGEIFGFQDTGVGDHVNVAPLKHGDWKTPPGHYGLMALYADGLLSGAPSNGNYQVTWGFVENYLSDYFIVDVRPNTAYCAGHIMGAINIPLATAAKPYNLDKLPTDQPILVYCGSGLLSSQVAPLLGAMGYQVRILVTPFAAVPAAYKVAACF